jgi:PII-like signaling protein
VDRRHNGKQLSEWLISLALEMHLPGATQIAAVEGFGSDRRIHSAHFIELTDQPVEIQMTVSSDDAERLFDRLRDEKVQLFYVKSPVEFGMLGGK